MSVLQLPKRTLAEVSVHGAGKTSLKELTEQAREFGSKWHDTYVDNSDAPNFSLTENMQIQYVGGGETKTADITEDAFQQLCTRIGGAPAGYLTKCAENGMTDLAVQNFQAWAEQYHTPMLFREYDGSVRAALSAQYERYDSWKILKELGYTIDEQRFEPVQVHLSPERFTARFVDYTPLKVSNDKSEMFAGFSVSSSDVGDGGLKIVFFLYRFVCRNGMLIPSSNGVAYRGSHRGQEMRMSKIASFSGVFNSIDTVIEEIPAQISAKQHKLSSVDLKYLLATAKAKVRMTDENAQAVTNLIGTVYPQTEWGFMNAVTEAAQNYELERRMELEQFAGGLLVQR